MRPEAFTSQARGVVRKTATGFYSFFPNPLPRRLDLPSEVVVLLDEATGAVHRLGGVGRLIPNPHLLIGPHLRLEAVLSSRIEGTKTDVAQLLRFEAGDASRPEDVDDAREVQNYVRAMEHGLMRVHEGFPVSIRLFREMHELLLSGVRGQHLRPGDLRESPVWIGGTTLENAVFVPPTPDEMRIAAGRSRAISARARSPPPCPAGACPLPVRSHSPLPRRERPDRPAAHPVDVGAARCTVTATALPLCLLRAVPQPVLRPPAPHQPDWRPHALVDVLPQRGAPAGHATPKSGPCDLWNSNTTCGVRSSKRGGRTRWSVWRNTSSRCR